MIAKGGCEGKMVVTRLQSTTGWSGRKGVTIPLGKQAGTMAVREVELMTPGARMKILVEHGRRSPSRVVMKPGILTPFWETNNH